MTLNPGCEAEYQRRHDEIWPELTDAIHEAGVIDYRIFLDPQSHHLFVIMTRHRDHGLEDLSEMPVMRRWWAMMADIMETAPDNSPVSHRLSPRCSI